MDIKNLLCHTTQHYNVQQYEKQAFEYCPASPSSWSSASSKSSMDSPILSPMTPSPTTPPPPLASRKKQHQTRTPWTSSEDYLLEKGYLQGLSWAMISSKYLPHRSRGCCWGRFKTLQTRGTEKKHWAESEDRVLLSAIKKHTRLFKQAWRTVALDLSDRDWRECEIRSARISSILVQQHRQQQQEQQQQQQHHD
ncbi:hypothetical protein MAM1_0244d08627 [Mucor ambiguus]|uniref:Myb-like domain-containing protein n=1 Tax=Mucor ambiguus TaxID=91626 RepID=A0A0C9LWT9_9FUNG|nr:hypothetical protein MAM1_0244d08627 [Mucor ambiguus]